ncbi:MAG TPA: bifunctional metallophosphatase/5'-nucleotidase [Pseudomonas sp.]|nr:bifunctional metallophosphatase/5'-nucleotidase [Pseudomonas sp.]
MRSRFPASLALVLLLAGCASPSPQPVTVNLALINDFHGYLEPNPALFDQGRKGQLVGGIANVGGLIDHLRQEDPQTLVIGSGDLIGASPAVSALWADEPTLQAMNLLGLQLSAVGNHELDNGQAELLRQVRGGCDSSRPAKACQFESLWQGTRFPYLAANLLDARTNQPLFPAYRILQAHGQRIAFVGAVLKELDQVVSPKGLAGLKVTDEADSINAVIPELKARKVDAIVAIIHQGGTSPAGGRDCQDLQGPIVEVVKRLDPAIDLVASAHSHKAYTCHVGRMPVFQGGSYGQLVSHVSLQIDPRQHQVTRVRMENLPVIPGHYPPNPQLAAWVAQVAARSKTVLERPVARLGVPRLEPRYDAAGESALGDLIADAQLAAVRDQGAQIALMNSGGIRNELALAPGQSRLTYAQLASCQPFANTLTLVDLTGAQLRELLEQQWRRDPDARPLQVSAGFAYVWDARRPVGQRVVSGSIRLNGVALDDRRRYRVVANNFLADGGDGAALLKEGRNRLETGITDLEALERYLVRQDRQGTPAGQAEPAGRIRRQDG